MKQIVEIFSDVDGIANCDPNKIPEASFIEKISVEQVLNMANEGSKNILVFSPSFTADCLETIIEIGDEYNELFISSGGQKLDYVESLNYSDLWSDAIISIIK